MSKQIQKESCSKCGTQLFFVEKREGSFLIGGFVFQVICARCGKVMKHE